MSEVWIRARFKIRDSDYRPLKWPPPGPYWCSGFNEEYSVLIAYAKDENQILQYWPDAEDLESTVEQEIIFTDRFPKPSWWPIKK